MNRRFAAFALVVCFLAPFAAVAAPAPSLGGMLHWRSIGPFRGGRSLDVSGIPGEGRTFVFGAVGGGVWKTEDAGRTWKPVTDGLPVASIGAVAFAPSDPRTVYAGSGEADMREDITHGNGMYRSGDGGTTWTHIGLDDSRQIGRILVDPHDPETLLVAALGHAYAPNETRGVYRSTDGGASWTRVLFRDAHTGAIDIAAAPDFHTIYASLWQTQRPPWTVYPPSNGPGTSLWKSTDGGVTWSQLHGNGFPDAGLGKIGLAVAPSNPDRVYAIVDATQGGLYRSDDAGASWKRVDGDVRLWQRGWYFCHVAVDPKNADHVYISDTAVYESTNGGTTFTAVKGSPDGDDFHQMWIDPLDPAHMALASDQGTTISVDGGKTWSSWFNQPTGQFYHVATDTGFPYRLYGAQQDSGAGMIVSRSDHRGIQARDWRPISAGGESGMIAPDPHDVNIVYGGTVDREDLRTSQTRSVSPTTGKPGVWRPAWTLPLVFSPLDHALYVAHQMIFRSRDGGASWQQISRDLTRPETPRRGVVYALAPSPLRAQTLWAGTDDGLVYVTRDGGRRWENVTPPQLTAWSKVGIIDASYADAASAYVAVDRHRLDDDRPYIYVTHDYGHTWRLAVHGIPDGSFVNAVREDPVRRGLLYAGTESGVYVSEDDGNSWESLRLNMPVVSVRDISVRDGDLAIATHGRGFWILDDIVPLRELAASSTGSARLFRPRDAVRLRPGNDEAEASPPEVPVGENPSPGAYLDYAIPADARGPLELAVVDARGRVVRRWRSDDRVEPADPQKVDYPAYWLVTPQPPSAQPGFHRFVWDLQAARGLGRRRRAGGPYVPPGRYTVRMTLDGHTYSKPLVVVADPRVHATTADLVSQYALANEVQNLGERVSAAIAQADAARKQPGENVARIDAIAGAPPVNDPRNSVGSPATTFTTLRWYASALGDLESSIESADAAPTPAERATWSQLRSAAEARLSQWAALTGR